MMNEEVFNDISKRIKVMLKDIYEQGYKDASDMEYLLKCGEKELNRKAEEDLKDKTLTEYMDEKYKNREDKDNIFGVGVSDAEFRRFIIKYLLGDDWRVTDSLGQTQVNEIALLDILEKYSKRYKKELKAKNNISRYI